MTMQELGTVMEQKSPVKIILMNNNYLGNVRQWQSSPTSASSFQPSLYLSSVS